MSTRLTIPSPNHRENGDTKNIFNGEHSEDQTLTIIDTGGAEESKPNGIHEISNGTKPKIILHRQVGRMRKNSPHRLVSHFL